MIFSCIRFYWTVLKANDNNLQRIWNYMCGAFLSQSEPASSQPFHWICSSSDKSTATQIVWKWAAALRQIQISQLQLSTLPTNCSWCGSHVRKGQNVSFSADVELSSLSGAKCLLWLEHTSGLFWTRGCGSLLNWPRSKGNALTGLRWRACKHGSQAAADL